MESTFQFTFLLVQRLGSDAVTGLTPGIWSHDCLKRSKKFGLELHIEPTFQFTFLLVQRLLSDAVTDLTPGIWSHIRLKRSNKFWIGASHGIDLSVHLPLSEAPGI
ncbi:hypothetical protein J6590_006346 [Homalodisca vitripennis]|nr:hypothetical protein J6590_006346 [Homalodisca vitripennis]